MYSLGREKYRSGNIGKPLPSPYREFDINKISFRYGATSMIAGRPGSYKSVLGLNLMCFWALRGLGILYFSADSDAFTVRKRVGGILTGDNVMDAVEPALTAGNSSRYDEAMRGLEGVQFVYDQPDTRDNRSEMEWFMSQLNTYEQAYGGYPDVIFIDNLIDFAERPDDWGGMLCLTKQLDAMARDCKAHVSILHHAKQDKPQQGSGGESRPPQDWEIQGKITQIPRLVLTVGAFQGRLSMACVKNTNGPQDPSASSRMTFFVTDSLQIREQPSMGEMIHA